MTRATGLVTAAESGLGLVRASRSEYSPDILSCVVPVDKRGGDIVLSCDEERKWKQYMRHNNRVLAAYISVGNLSLASLAQGMLQEVFKHWHSQKSRSRVWRSISKGLGTRYL